MPQRTSNVADETSNAADDSNSAAEDQQCRTADDQQCRRGLAAVPQRTAAVLQKTSISAAEDRHGVQFAAAVVGELCNYKQMSHVSHIAVIGKRGEGPDKTPVLWWPRQ